MEITSEQRRSSRCEKHLKPLIQTGDIRQFTCDECGGPRFGPSIGGSNFCFTCENLMVEQSRCTICGEPLIS